MPVTSRPSLRRSYPDQVQRVAATSAASQPLVSGPPGIGWR